MTAPVGPKWSQSERNQLTFRLLINTVHLIVWCLLSGSGPSYSPMGEIQLTVRHSSQRNKLIVVVHSCRCNACPPGGSLSPETAHFFFFFKPAFSSPRNLIAYTDHGSDPYVRLYLLPDKRRSGRRKTHTFKRNLNPIYDQT